ARFAEDPNVLCSPPEVPRRLGVLAAHCEDVGGGRSEITVSVLRSGHIGGTQEEAMATPRRYFAERGLDEEAFERARGLTMSVGDPDELGEQFQAMRDAGVDGFVCNLPSTGHDPENVELLGKTLAAVVG